FQIFVLIHTEKLNCRSTRMPVPNRVPATANTREPTRIMVPLESASIVFAVQSFVTPCNPVLP
ncbi:MAG: hypothetical protein WCI18_17120, partial [Pseudomonadota bacterium]